MYNIIHPRNLISSDDYVLIGVANTLEQASKIRKTSGDLVVDQDLKIVPDQAWLFEWEKSKPSCYARRAIEAKVQFQAVYKRISLPLWF